MVAHTFNARTQKMEAGGSGVGGTPLLRHFKASLGYKRISAWKLTGTRESSVCKNTCCVCMHEYWNSDLSTHAEGWTWLCVRGTLVLWGVETGGLAGFRFVRGPVSRG